MWRASLSNSHQRITCIILGVIFPIIFAFSNSYFVLGWQKTDHTGQVWTYTTIVLVSHYMRCGSVFPLSLHMYTSPLAAPTAPNTPSPLRRVRCMFQNRTNKSTYFVTISPLTHIRFRPTNHSTIQIMLLKKAFQFFKLWKCLRLDKVVVVWSQYFIQRCLVVVWKTNAQLVCFFASSFLTGGQTKKSLFVRPIRNDLSSGWVRAVREWVSGWVSGWVGEWVSGWVG
jgi:hypothetical protein